MSPALMERYLTAARVDQPARRSAARRRRRRASIYRVSAEVQQHDRTRPAVRHARRHAGPPRLPAGRRVQHQGRAASGRDAAAMPQQLEITHRRRAGEAVRAGGARASRTVRVAGHGRPARRRRHVLRTAARPRRAGARAVPESGRTVRHRRAWPGRCPRSPAVTIAGRTTRPAPAIRRAGAGSSPARRRARRRKRRCAKTILTTLARRAYRGAVDARAASTC